MRAPIIVSIMLFAGVAHADESPAPPWQVRAFGGARFFTDSSAVTLAEQPLGNGGFSVERRITTLSLPGPFEVLDLSAEIGLETGATHGTTFQQLNNDIFTWQATAGGRARLPLTPWLHATGRAAVGGGWTHARIYEMSSTTGVKDAHGTFGAQAAIGLSLLPRITQKNVGHAVFFGLDVELGYQATTAMTVHAIPEDRPAPELTIPAAYASLGDLDLDGWTLRVGTAIGF